MIDELTALVVQLCELLISWVWRLWFSSSCAKAIWSQRLLFLECFAIYCSEAGALVAELHLCSGGCGWTAGAMVLSATLCSPSPPHWWDSCRSLPRCRPVTYVLHAQSSSYFLFHCFRLLILGCSWVVETRPKGITAKRIKWGRKQQGTSAGIEFVDTGAVRKVHLN